MENVKTKQNGSIIAIITMMFLYAMIAFVTNLAAPIGVVWKNQPGNRQQQQQHAGNDG